MLYLTPDLFVDALILVLYYPSEQNNTLVNNILNIYEKEQESSTYSENAVLNFYVDIIRYVMERGVNLEDSNQVDLMLLRFRSHPLMAKDPELYTILKRIFTEPNIDPDREKYLVRKLNNAYVWYQNTQIVKKMFGRLANGANLTMPEQQEKVLKDISDLCKQAIQENEGIGRNEVEAGLDEHRTLSVDFSKKEEIKKAFEVYKSVTTTARFITGLQGINRALNGGFPMGSSIVHNSLSFHAKTYCLLKYARWQIMYNAPPAGILNPTVFLYSLENEVAFNTNQIFTELYTNLYQKLPPTDMTTDDIVELCYDKFQEYGWKLVIIRKLGAEFGYHELVEDLMSYVRIGYTPIMVIIDYMNLLKRDVSGDKGSNWIGLKEVYNLACNFCKSRVCTLVTAHQLNRQAAELARMYPTGAVKKFGIGHLAEGMDPQREVDIVFYQHKDVDAAGRSFLTFKLDKDRYDPVITPQRQFFAYLFRGDLGIMDDINGPDQSVTNINAVPFDDDPQLAAELQEILSAPDESLSLELKLEEPVKTEPEPAQEIKEEEQTQPEATLSEVKDQAKELKGASLLGI